MFINKSYYSSLDHLPLMIVVKLHKTTRFLPSIFLHVTFHLFYCKQFLSFSFFLCLLSFPSLFFFFKLFKRITSSKQLSYTFEPSRTTIIVFILTFVAVNRYVVACYVARWKTFNDLKLLLIITDISFPILYLALLQLFCNCIIIEF